MPPPRTASRASARRCWPRCSPRRSLRRAASPASRSPRPRRGCRRIRAIPRWPRQSAVGRTRPPTLSELYRRRDELAEAQRQGAIAPELGRRRSRQADQRCTGDAGRCRCGVAGRLAQLRAARPAGGAGERRVRRTASRRGVRRDHAQRGGRLGVPAAQRRHRGIQDRWRPGSDCRTGAPGTRRHRTDHRAACRRSTSPTRRSFTN